MHKQEETSPLIKVDKSTLVPVGLLVTVVLSAISMTTWLQGSISEMRGTQEKNVLVISNEMNMLRFKIEELGTKISNMNENYIQFDTIQNWVTLLRAQNPTMTIPDLPKHR